MMLKKSLVFAAAVLLAASYAWSAEIDLEKAFDQAFSAGEPLKADQAFRNLVEKKPNTAAIRYYQGAEVSRQLGKTTERRTRLAHYLRIEKNWNETTEQAAWEMCLSANDADQFTLLSTKVPASRTLLNAGLQLLDTFRNQKRAADFKKVATALLQTFKDSGAREAVYGRIGGIMVDGVPGFSYNDARGFFDRYPAKSMDCLDWTMRMRQDAFSPLWRLNYMAKNQVLMTPEPYQYTWNINYGKQEERAEAGKCLKQIEKLALDGKHPSQTYWWLRQAAELHEQFFKPADSNQCSAAFLAWYDKAAACNPKIGEKDLRDLMQYILERCIVPNDRTKLTGKYPQYCHSGVALGYGGLNGACDRNKNANAIVDFLNKNPGRHDVAWEALRTLAKYGAKQQVFSEIEYRVVNSWDNRLDCWHVFYAICETKGASDQEKADFMAKLYAKTGAHQFFYFLMDDKRPRTHVAMTNKTCQAFFASLKKGTKSNERIVEIRREMAVIGRGDKNICPDSAHKLYAEACKVFPEPLRSGANAKHWANGIMDQITGKYIDLCQHNMESAPIGCQAVMDKLAPKDASLWYGVFGWNNLVWNARDGKDGFYYKATVRRAQNTDDPNYLGGLGFPKDTEKLPEGITADKFRARELGDMLRTNWAWNDGNRRNFKPALMAQMAGLWFKKFDIRTAVDDWNWMEDFMRTVTSAAWADQKGFTAAIPFDKVAGELFADPTSRDQYARWFLQLCRAAGVGEKYANQYLAALAKLEPAVRLNLLVRVMEMEDVITYGDSAKKIPDVWSPAFNNHLMPALKAVPTKHAPLAFLGGYGHLMRRVEAVCNWENQECSKMTDKAAAKTRKQASDANLTAFVNENIRLKNLGASGWWEDNRRGAALYYVRKYEMGLATTNSAVLASVAQNTGATMNPWTIGWDWMRSILGRTQKEQQWEALYLLVNSLPDYDKDLTAYAARLRGEASTHLPGVYPVTERDPLYPLYVAADEFHRNNLERANGLLMKNLPTFERFAIQLPPDFTAWGVEQLRLARGTKDAMLIKARALATKLLENESKITPELAAAMLLVRAECYRDQQNFEAAKLEYQTIRNSPVYSKTPSGRKAMFRAIDLMIETGNASAAESTIEYWLSQPDREVQAQAHYFLAKIAFERKDFEEARKQLKEVFAIDFTHTEGRFLEGKWKLSTGNEVDDTEVLIGRLADRTVIRPGQQLSVTVQDRNLSIAGGGASIPLIVTTTPGGDRERVYLFPTQRDPTTFKGVVDVKLGKAVVSNLVLEVTGNDKASYEVDPEFLKVRGLPRNEPKVLRVVDDARLAIGPGMPRTDEEETKKRLAKMVEQGGVEEVRGSLRPGNPLYIAVLDKDCSMGDGSEVTVDVRTTSGDKVENLVLKEVKPFSGVFRGEIPTSLPPPRAFASDTAVGYNPGDAISSTHPGEWKSLSDGLPGKWFAVDTMGSHLFSNVTFRLNAPEEVKKIRLSGTLGGENVVLGMFPSGNPRLRAGLKCQQEWNVNTRSAAEVKTFFDKPNAPKTVAVTNIAVTMKYNNGNALVSYFQGAFKMEGGHDSLRLKVVPASTHGDTFKNLWLTAKVDGKDLITGTGPSLVNALGVVELEPGCHKLEVFASTKTGDDSWRLEWEPYGEESRLVPCDWFDAEKHPEIYEFVADKAKIARTKDGFEAVFAKPYRLRTVKVEFLDRNGPDVQLNAFTATDSAGKAILPVESDFSDAQKNQNLEVAPGDSISVRYTDERTTKGSSRILTKNVGSSFTNGSVGFYFEEIVQSSNGGEPQSVLHEAYRFMPGDTLLVAVHDADLDLTEEADTVSVTVTTIDGTKRDIKLIEQQSRHSEEMEGVHSGYFLGLLKTCPPSVTNAPSSVLRCSGEEVLVVTYQDRENTNPGVPCLRSSRVNATQPFDPIITLFHTRKHLVVDKSAEAKARLAQIRRRAGNEKVDTLYTTVVNAIPMSRKICASTNDIIANVAAPLPIRVNDPSRARHQASYLKVEAVSESEINRAEMDGDDPVKVTLKLPLMGGFSGVNLLKGGEAANEARLNGSFNGCLTFAVGGVDPNLEAEWTNPDQRPAIVSVNGSDRVFLRVLDSEGKELLTRTVKLVSNGSIALQDSTWNAERLTTHVGERFYVKVEDPDRDATDEADRITVDVQATGGNRRKIVLAETLPHSGVFTGTVRPVIFPPNEEIPGVATGLVADVDQLMAEDRMAVKYGEKLVFGYYDEFVLPGTKPSTLCVTGGVHKGANGDVRLFSKRFRDADMAVLVQFRLAECLFEQAKDHRKLKHKEKSAEAIAKGRNILEEALKNNPESSHIAEGEFLLANLYQELGSEAKQARDAAKKAKETEKMAEAETQMKTHFTEALARFSSILAVWPEGEFAPRAQYHKAYCLEMLGDYKLAGEEYVKMTYLYPESELVGDATIRLATYYYRMEKRYEVAAKIYENFARRFPQHDKAARSLFMCGSCYVKQAEKIHNEAKKAAKKWAIEHKKEYREPDAPGASCEAYARAVLAFDDMAEKYRSTTTPELRAQALYWAGDASLRRGDARKSYLYLKRTILEYPETEWARRARGVMLQNGKKFKDLD